MTRRFTVCVDCAGQVAPPSLHGLCRGCVAARVPHKITDSLIVRQVAAFIASYTPKREAA